MKIDQIDSFLAYYPWSGYFKFFEGAPGHSVVFVKITADDGTVGWGQSLNFDAAEDALQNSIFAVTARSTTGEVIAMGRIVGDGAIYFYIQDLVVSPDVQGQGIGTAIMARGRAVRPPGSGPLPSPCFRPVSRWHSARASTRQRSWSSD